MYAIVRCGGRQEKASVDDVLTVDRLNGEVGSTLTLRAVLVVDGDNVVTDPEELGGYSVAAEIVGDVSGPKIDMIRYKNKTGYRRRLGHRQRYTQVKITGITKGGGRPASKSASAGKPAAASKTADAGKPAAASKTADAGKPAAAGKAAPAGKAASAGKAAPAGKAASAAKPADVGQAAPTGKPGGASKARPSSTRSKAATSKAETAEES